MNVEDPNSEPCGCMAGALPDEHLFNVQTYLCVCVFHSFLDQVVFCCLNITIVQLVISHQWIISLSKLFYCMNKVAINCFIPDFCRNTLLFLLVKQPNAYIARNENWQE